MSLEQVGIIFGVLGFSFSMILAILQFLQRLSKLRLLVIGVDPIDFSAQSEFVVLHLALTNRATVPRTVFRLHFDTVSGIQVSPIAGQPDFLAKVATFSFGGKRDRSVQLLFDDVASWPLDVEPQRSRSFYLPVAIAPISQPPLGTPDWEPRTIVIPVLAQDENGQTLARALLRVPTWAS